jgi:long-chain acyl-CoA synthetase
VIQGYGLTETTSLVSLNHPFRLGKGSIGKILPGREIKLDETGEILVRGENIAAGYWRNKETKPVQEEQGWFHTGDVGELDEAGNLYFKGRKKSVIVTPEGMKVYPEDLEAALRRQPEVRECVVIGLNRHGNALPCAVLIMRDGSQEAESAVRRANESLAEFQRMHHWFVWPDEDFPRTSTQKPKTNEIQDWVRARLEGLAQSGAPAGTLAELIGRVTGRAPPVLSSASNLTADLNLTSIDRVELLSALEDRYQIDLNETRFTSATTVGELERMLRSPIPRRSDYRYPRWTQRWPMNLLRVVVYYILTWPATMLMAHPRIRGRENLRGVEGPVLVIANHITQIDVGFVLAAVPTRLRHRLAVAMLGEMLQSMRHPPSEFGFFKRWFEKSCYALVVALFNVFPLPQQTGFRESFSFAGESADRGYSILVFPEGRRTQDGKLQPFRSGIGMLALNLNLPIVPVRIDGLFELKQSGKKLTRIGTVTVTIGAPVSCEPGVEPEALALQLEERMASL